MSEEKKCPKCNSAYEFSEARLVKYACGSSEILGEGDDGFYPSFDCIQTQLTTTQSKLAKAITALEEIKGGKGEYNREPLIHARNTIESMKALASTTLAELKGQA
jgi:hypothetical protein